MARAAQAGHRSKRHIGEHDGLEADWHEREDRVLDRGSGHSHIIITHSTNTIFALPLIIIFGLKHSGDTIRLRVGGKRAFHITILEDSVKQNSLG
jgi:hypothetical protein